MSLLAAPIRRAFVVLLTLAASARAQLPASPISHLEDAAPISAGMLRLSIANVWTRYDQRFAASGASVPLGDELSADSLGSAQFPRLLPIEAGLRTLAVDPALRLSLGRLRVGSNARVVVTPIALEYGVTRRFSIGVLIPIVETRRVAIATVSGDSTRANVGYVPTTLRPAAAAANALVSSAFKKAADSLGVLLNNCPSNPGASGCAAVNANRADATAARARAQAFADAATTLGTTPDQALVAPRKSSDLADTLEARRIQLNARLQQYLGASAGAATGVFTAPTDFSYIDLNGRNGVPAFLGGPLGGGLDSIHTTERIGFGDIAIGARLLVFDHFQSGSAPPPRVQTRLAVGAAVRLPTSLPDTAQSLLDIGTGDGAGVDLHSAWDIIVGHVGATIGARYSKSFGRTVQAPLVNDPLAVYPYPLFGPRTRTAGDVFGLDVTPRILVTDWLALDGHYGLERVGPTTFSPATIAQTDPCATCQSLLGSTVDVSTGASRTAQRYGVGLRYSTVDAFARGQARYPVEIAYAHLETASGDAGLPKQTREQIEVRLFYQLRRP